MINTEWLAACVATALALFSAVSITKRLRTSDLPEASVPADNLARLTRQPGGAVLPPTLPAERDTSEDLFTAAFIYIDARGYRTDRVVSVVICDDEFFAGYCHLRHDYRTFAWRHIDGTLILESGESVTPAQLQAQYS